MSFATEVDNRLITGCFGIKFYLYNYTTSDLTPAIQVCNNDKFGPTWQPCLTEVSGVDYTLAFGQAIADVSDLTFTIANGVLQHALGSQAHETVGELIAEGYHWKGNTVHLYLLVMDEPAGSIVSSEIWDGYIVNCEVSGAGVTFDCVNSAHYEAEEKFPDTTIILKNYAEAPASSVGDPLPIVYGDYDVPEYDQGYGGHTDALDKAFERMGLQLPAKLVPCLCTDTNESNLTTGPVFHLSKAECKEFPLTHSASVFRYIPELQQLAPIDSSTFTITNAGAATYITFDKVIKFQVAVRPHEIGTCTGTVDPEKSYDGDASTYARLSEINDLLQLKIERPPDLGELDSIRVMLLRDFTLDSATGEFGLADLSIPDFAGGHSDIGDNTIGTDPLVDYHDVTMDNFDRVEDLPVELGVRLKNTTSDDYGQIDIFEVAVSFVFKARHIAEPAIQAGITETLIPRRRGGYDIHVERTVEPDQYPQISEKNGIIFAAVKGTKDTAGGTVTGTANALIECPAAVLYSVLAQATDLTVNTTSDPGDIDKAVDDQQTDGIKSTIFFDTRKSFRDWAEELCRQSGLGLTIGMHSGVTKIGAVYWGSAASQNLYGTAIPFTDVLHDRETHIGWTPQTDTYSGVYIYGDYDPRTRTFRTVAMADGTDSDDGTGTDDYGSKAALASSKTNYKNDDFSLKATHIAGGIAAVRDLFAGMLPEPRVALRFSLPWKYYDLQVGHVIQLDSASWVAGGRLYPEVSGGVWTDQRFWVERVSFSDDGYMEIEASEGVW
jgi:hypothetical protein